jgi:N-acetylneuraminate synthase
MDIKIGNKTVGADNHVYFIADIAANHDGDIERAKKLIRLAKESGADAAKFQHFTADKIVSDYGFKHLSKDQLSHQAKWGKSVFDVYRDAEINRDWTKTLFDYCQEVGIHFFSSPYDFDAVDMLDKYMPAYKIGSGDITWNEILVKIAQKNKPVLLATGASNMAEVDEAVKLILAYNKQLVVMQCNTNYTASLENFKYISLNVLNTYKSQYPNVVLGLSDHTLGCVTVLGAVALGARVIEKHFTDDNNRVGPDHGFAMNPATWRDMVEKTREMEKALGSSIKKVEDNEKETVVLQRRCLRAAKDIKQGTIIKSSDFEALRPAPTNAIKPSEMKFIVGKMLRRDIEHGEHLTMEDIC